LRRKAEISINGTAKTVSRLSRNKRGNKGDPLHPLGVRWRHRRKWWGESLRRIASREEPQATNGRETDLLEESQNLFMRWAFSGKTDKDVCARKTWRLTGEQVHFN